MPTKIEKAYCGEYHHLRSTKNDRVNQASKIIDCIGQELKIAQIKMRALTKIQVNKITLKPLFDAVKRTTRKNVSFSVGLFLFFVSAKA